MPEVKVLCWLRSEEVEEVGVPSERLHFSVLPAAKTILGPLSYALTSLVRRQTATLG